MKIAIDTSLLVGLLVPNDSWHEKSLSVWEIIRADSHEPIFFDCVALETISIVSRRLNEKGLSSEFKPFLLKMTHEVPKVLITWLFPEMQDWYDDILQLVLESRGLLNTNDALIALACREREISLIASFDADFDQVTWLKRISKPEHLA